MAETFTGGLDTEYLGSEFMRMVRACVEHAAEKNLLACLCDEDRWPSGCAGGKAVKDYRSAEMQWPISLT